MEGNTEVKRLLAVQQAIAGDIAGATSRGALLEQVLETLGEALGWSWGAAWEAAASGDLRCSATWRTGDELAAFEEASRAMDPAPPDALPVLAVQSNAPVWVPEVTGENVIARARIAGEAGLVSAVAFPLAVGDVHSGAIEFFGPAIGEPDADLLAMFASVGTQLAQCLDRWDSWERLADSEAFSRSVIAALDEGVIVFDADGQIASVNASAERILGLAPDEMIGRTPRALGDPAPVIRVLHEDGSLMTPDTSFALEALRTGRESPHGVVISMADITERRRAARELERLAYHDHLTGLPNRTLLQEHLDLAIARGGRQGHGVALLFLDLDDFKLVNDRFGHAAGDRLLRDVARRLEAVTRSSDLLARHGGDELLLLVSDLGDDAEAVASSVASKLAAALEEPFQVGESDVAMRASIGVSIFPRDAEDASSLMRHADAAMYEAKGAGRGRVRVYGR